MKKKKKTNLPEQQSATSPTKFQCSYLEINLHRTPPSPTEKRKTKINHEGKEGKTSRFFKVCLRPTAATASLGFYLLLWCPPALDCKKKVLHTQTAEGFIEQRPLLLLEIRDRC